MNSILKIQNLSVYFGKNKVLNNINLDINEGCITSIIGPSGCGKSTFLKSINRILEEENSNKIEGNILFKDIDIKNIKLEQLRKNIGMVFQTPTPFPMSIYKNLTYAPMYYGIKSRKELHKIVEDKLKLVGIYEEIKENLNKSALELSGGQQQRVCIARALTVDPKILLLDEPCSALDVNNTRLIEKMLLELKKHYTIVIVTHNLAQAKRISDYTAFFLDGEIIEYNSTDNIFNNCKEEKTKEYIMGMYG